MENSCDQAYLITGLDCPACAERVVRRLEKDPRVEEANIDFGAGKLYFTGEKIDLGEMEKIVNSVESIFHVKNLEISAKKPSIFGFDFYFRLGRIVISLILAILGMTLFTVDRFGLWVNLAINIVAWLIVGYDIAWRFISNLIHLRNIFDESLLMTLASVGGFLLPLVTNDYMSFFDSVLVVALYQVGELFDGVATKKSHEAIVSAAGMKTSSANLVTDGGVKVIKPEELKVGDVVLLKVGEGVPSDGVIVDGEGSLDISSLTGEFEPVYKKEGDEVLSGTTLKSGSLKIRIAKPYQDSTISHILNLVENSGRGKSSAERFITRFSKYYTPLVVVISVFTMLLPPLFLGIGDGAVWARYVQVGLSFLVIACPCAIVVSVPLTYFAGIGLASKRGVIVKGASYFDKLSNVKTLVSDKTGTLTYGDFQVSKWNLVSLEKCDFMVYLKAAESRSAHPIAKAIIGDSDKDGSLAAEQSEYEEIAGKGVKTLYKGQHVIAGTSAFLKENGYVPSENNENGTVIHLGVDGIYEGYVVLNDIVRKESSKMVAGLHSLGIKVELLTGDKKKSADSVALELGIDEVHSELLPEDKTEYLKKEIAKKNGNVAYIGDGINDAPSIALADVGIAMGGIGSDSSINNADCVIMNDDPSKSVTAIKIAKKCNRRSIFIICFGLAVKLSIMIVSLVLGSAFPLWAAVAADTGLTVVMVLYAFTLLYSKVQ